ncbi:MAG: 1-deoxy-D-xylulose-5-phosphate reductoisomerase [Chloroflexota bacterium]
MLGSTGSIGRQTLDVARQFPDRIQVWGLAAGSNIEDLAQQAAEFRPEAVSLHNALPPADRFPGTQRLSGEQGMIDLVSHPDVDLVIVASTGRSGLIPTIAAITAGKRVALANKETLVMAGEVIQAELRSGTGSLVPIDSEHSAIWQCLQGEPEKEIERLTLTASGGALRDLSSDELAAVTPELALRHPTWSMGPKITIDSANLMNKGLEVLEAQWLFDVPIGSVDIIMHRQSMVHSLVTFSDGSTKAQLGMPNMRLPIQYALSHPDRWCGELPRLDLAAVGELTFGAVDLQLYPALRLALEAGRRGGTYPAVLSAADEIAVAAFLGSRLRFTHIPIVVERVLNEHRSCSTPRLNDILDADAWARTSAWAAVSTL